MCESIIVGVQRCCSYVMHLSYNHSIANIHPALTSTELRVSVIVKSTYLCIAFILATRRTAASLPFMFQLEKNYMTSIFKPVLLPIPSKIDEGR